jgi:hypothetical protein
LSLDPTKDAENGMIVMVQVRNKGFDKETRAFLLFCSIFARLVSRRKYTLINKNKLKLSVVFSFSETVQKTQ